MDIEKIKARWDYASKLKQDELEKIAEKANTKVFQPMVSRERQDVWELIDAYEKFTAGKTELKNNAKEILTKPPQGTNVESKDSKSHNIPANG